jgi:phage FluMu protein Com
MNAIRCGSCGFTISGGDHQHLKLMNDVRKWVNYLISVHVQAGTTARHLNRSKECPPCPNCKAVGTWENVIPNEG